MTQRSDRPIVGFDPAIDQILTAYTGSAEGPRAVVLDGSPGSGRRTLVGRALARLVERKEEPCAISFGGTPEDDPVRTLLRVYAALVTALARGRGFDVDPVDHLRKTAEGHSDTRVKEWLAGIATNARDLRAHSGGGNFQIKLPRDNPYLALMHAFDTLGPRGRFLVDLHDVGLHYSPTFWTFLSAFVGRARARNWKVLFVAAPGENIFGEKPGEAVTGPRAFLADLFPDAVALSVPKLDAAAVQQLLDETYRPHSFPKELATRLAEVSAGHPDDLHEVLDALEEDETLTWNDSGYALSDLDDVDLDLLVPVAAENEDGDEVDDKDLRERILYVAAIEGREFTASLIRTFLDAAEDAVDDALDDMPQLIEQGRYHQGLGTWTYRFKKGFARDWYRANTPEGLKEKQAVVARKLATLMLQSYAPAVFEYVPKASGLFVAAADTRSARNLLTMAMGADRTDIARLAIEIAQVFADSPWPAGLLRQLYSGAADRAVNGEGIEVAKDAIQRARTWATDTQDARTLAYMLLLEARLGIREGDPAGAASKGHEALAAFEAAGDPTRVGETLNQLAMIAFNRGDAAAAADYATKAEKASSIPPVRAHTLYIQALLDKRAGQLATAMTLFERSVELSTEAGNLVLVLEGILHLGECALVIGKGKEVAPMLERALEMSRALRATSRERTAARLLCQAEAARGRAEPALAMAKHALDLTRELGLTNQEHVDLYHCGLFSAMAGKHQEAADYLGTARTAAEKSGDKGIVGEILFNLAQVRAMLKDWDGARGLMEQVIGNARSAGDLPREVRAIENLGAILGASGDHRGAAAKFEEAGTKAPAEAADFKKAMEQRAARAMDLAAGKKAAPAPSATA